MLWSSWTNAKLPRCVGHVCRITVVGSAASLSRSRMPVQTENSANYLSMHPCRGLTSLFTCGQGRSLLLGRWPVFPLTSASADRRIVTIVFLCTLVGDRPYCSPVGRVGLYYLGGGPISHLSLPVQTENSANCLSMCLVGG